MGGYSLDPTASSMRNIFFCSHHNLEQDVVRTLLLPRPHPQQGEGGGDAEIIHSRRNWIDFLSSEVTEEHLASLGLDCHKAATMDELMRSEAQDNPDILRYHASSDWLDGGGSVHTRLLRSVEDTGEGNGEGATIRNYAFNRYVSLQVRMQYPLQASSWTEFVKFPSAVPLNQR